MRVIGAGFGRTGTASLKAALEELGFGPCYHMTEVFEHPEHADFWQGAWREEPDKPFPRLNDAAEMRRRIRSVQALGLAVPAVLALLGVAVLALLGRRAGSKIGTRTEDAWTPYGR